MEDDDKMNMMIVVLITYFKTYKRYLFKRLMHHMQNCGSFGELEQGYNSKAKIFGSLFETIYLEMQENMKC